MVPLKILFLPNWLWHIAIVNFILLLKVAKSIQVSVFLTRFDAKASLAALSRIAQYSLNFAVANQFLEGFLILKLIYT